MKINGNRRLILLIIFSCLVPQHALFADKFSGTIAKLFTQKELARVSDQAEVVWEKGQTKPFNELIVSLNALRPCKGALVVWVSVKHNGNWSSWHRLMEWGADRQRTFTNRLNRFVHTKHCRVEMMRGAIGRGFRVKVTKKDGASLENLKAIFACMSRLNKFRFKKPKVTALASVAVQNVPRQSQMVLRHPRYTDLCSPVSTSMISAYFYQKLYGTLPADQMSQYAIDFAAKVHDQGYLDIYGNWILNVAQAFDAVNGEVFFRVERLDSFYDLHYYLAKKIPVAVSVRRLHGGATPYANGHILVVVGWNRQKRRVICLDPAFGSNRSVLKAYRLHDFLRAWRRSMNLAYVPMPR